MRACRESDPNGPGVSDCIAGITRPAASMTPASRLPYEARLWVDIAISRKFGVSTWQRMTPRSLGCPRGGHTALSCSGQDVLARRLDGTAPEDRPRYGDKPGRAPRVAR